MVAESRSLVEVYSNYFQNKHKRRVRRNNLEMLNQAVKDNFIALVIDRK